MHFDQSTGGGVVGRVTAVRGSTAQISLTALRPDAPFRVTVGSFLSIVVAGARLIGVINEISNAPRPGADADIPVATVDLVGEIGPNETGAECFHRGVSGYPTIGDAAEMLEKHHMRLVYEARHARAVEIGHLFHDKSMPAMIDVDSLLARHFAILGSTGVGKSSGVAIVLREILAVRPDLRVFLLDCHNEYGNCFGERAHVVSSRDLKLPFWMFNFEEFVDVIYGGRNAVEEELEILSELIPIAKGNYLQYKQVDRLSLKRMDPKASGYTVDTPVPYLLQDLVALLDERMGKLENRSSRMNYHRLMARIDTIKNNPRYDFMFENANVGGDTMADLLNQLFRIDPAGKPITIMQLAGLPVEVVDAVVCVLCRMAFDFGLWSDGASPMLFVCEEAHRYASLDQSIGFGPTRRALSRIAKEGRKYGVYLGLVSQRPSELDPNIISQCATLFAMRMTNDHDQALMRSAISDNAANLLDFLPSLSTREVIGFGEGVPFPARLRFKTLPPGLLSRNDAAVEKALAPGQTLGTDFVQEVVDRWRRAVTGRRMRAEDSLPTTPATTAPAAAAPAAPMPLPPGLAAHAAPPSMAAFEAEPVTAASRLDQARFQLLRR